MKLTPVRPRLTAVAATTTLALSGFALIAPAAPAVAAPGPVAPEAIAAAGWLAAQRDADDGLFHYLDPWSTPAAETVDVGATIDFGLSLVATGARPDVLAEVSDAVAAALVGYVGPTHDPSTSGRVAKAAAFLGAAGEDLSAVGGLDLAQRLEGAVDDTSGQLGAAPDVYGQTSAVTALRLIDSDELEAAADFLVAQRCAGGAWGYTFGGTCTSTVDATAYTVLALGPLAEDDQTAADAVSEATDWLLDQQNADGGFGDWGVNPGGSTSEANGTGLAAWALGEAGLLDEARAAARWVADHQVVAARACASPLNADAGALAYDENTYRSALIGGIGDLDQQNWVLASAQALAGLRHLGARPATVIAASGPRTFVRAGSRQVVSVSGLRPGQAACVSGIGKAQWLVGSGSVSVVLPAGTAKRTLAIGHGAAQRTVVLHALAKATLKVKVAAKVKRGKKFTVRITGLAPRERAVIKVGNRRSVALASSTGVAKIRAKAIKKRGKVRISVVGFSADRKGRGTVRIR